MKHRLKGLHLYFYMWMILLKSSCTRTQLIASTTLKPLLEAQKSDGMYFFMDINGSYKYAFDTGRGFQGAQSANHANEVTGHYTYYEKGVPYTVKYRSGVQGYQPEVIPRPTGQAVSKPVLSQFMQIGDKSHNHIVAAGAAQSAYHNLHSPPAVAAANFGGGGAASIQPSLKFVQDAMKTMQTRPIQLSFMSQQAHVQHPPSNQAAAASSLVNRALLAPVSRSEAQQINSLAETTPPETQLSKRPYTFSYLSDQSSHSESADRSGNVMGKYSYYDEAGYHDLAYKAGDDIGFVILGGSLAKPKIALNGLATPPAAAGGQRPQLIVNVSQMPQGSYNYKVEQLHEADGHVSANTIKNDDGRSLRKFRRFAHW